MDTLVLGIGNTLLSDEGVGVHATRYMSQRYGDLENIRFMDGGTLSFTLTTPIENTTNLIVIDAAQLNESPGTFRTFVGSAMDDYLNGQTRRSVHEVGLMDLMSMVRLAGRLPTNRALVAIQPDSIVWGTVPTQELRTVIPDIAEKVMELVHRWDTANYETDTCHY